jgi:hypothetical protein
MSNVLNQGVALLPAASESQATAIAGAALFLSSPKGEHGV